jgi:fengycin family lipopeptide synthetase D
MSGSIATLDHLLSDARRILNNTSLGAEDDLVKMGADSLALLEIAEAASERLGCEIQINQVWEAGSLSALLGRSDPKVSADQAAPSVRLVAGGRWSAAPQQRRFYALHRPLNTKLSQVVSCQIHLTGHPESEVVTSALRSIVERYDALHTRFEESEDGLWQIDVGELAFEVEEIDICAFGDNWRATYDQIITRETARLYDPRHWPLFRCAVVRTTQGTTVLFHAYHLVFDGTSRAVLHRELLQRLKHPGQDGSYGAPISFNYSDYCNWANARLKRPEYRRARDFWFAVFGGGFAPFHLKRSNDQNLGAAGYVARLGAQPSGAVRRVARQTGITEYTLLIAGFLGFLLRSYSDVTVGIPTAGRNHPESRNLIGMFQNNVFIRARRGEYSAFPSFLRVVQERVIRALQNQEFQYDELLRDRGNESALTGVYFNHLREPLRFMPPEGYGVHYVIGGRMKAELAANYQWAHGDIVFDLKYDTEVFSQGDVESFQQHYVDFFQLCLEEV